MGVSSHTTRSYLDALVQTFMVRVLQPYRPDDLLMRETALNLALSQRSDHDGMLVVPMPYGEFREMRIVRGSRKTWRQTVRPGDEVITVELR